MPGQGNPAQQHTAATNVAWRPVDGLVSEKIGAEVLVLERSAGRIHQFNHTAAIVWNGLVAGRSVAEIAERIAERYDVPDFRALKDATRMLLQLQVLKLITAEEPNQRPPSA